MTKKRPGRKKGAKKKAPKAPKAPEETIEKPED